jgi:hypothetical protein
VGDEVLRPALEGEGVVLAEVLLVADLEAGRWSQQLPAKAPSISWISQ